MHIDPIAVSEKVRGRGVDSRLLDESFMLAKASGKRKMTLEVVDANPGARRLDERKGFVVTRILNTALLTARAGFGKVLFIEELMA
jgi:ribosomal protein S18 acetylase RimI-like enzyme